MLKQILLFTIALLGLHAGALAQDINGDGKVTVLIPVNSREPSSGARGTLWQTQLWLYSGLDMPFTVGKCEVRPCGAQIYYPGETVIVADAPNNGAYVLDIDASMASHITLSARLFELTRHAQPAGVYIPVVREGQFSAESMRFLALDGSDKNRIALRVFDPFRLGGGSVHIEVILPTGAVAASTDITLGYTQSVSDPGFAAIYDLRAALPQLAAFERYDLVVTPVTPGMTLWALVSVTDQETQQVLLVCPD